jgi:hypothetical protein
VSGADVEEEAAEEREQPGPLRERHEQRARRAEDGRGHIDQQSRDAALDGVAVVPVTLVNGEDSPIAWNSLESVKSSILELKA